MEERFGVLQHASALRTGLGNVCRTLDGAGRKKMWVHERSATSPIAEGDYGLRMAISPIVILIARALFSLTFVRAAVEHLADIEHTTDRVSSAGFPFPRVMGIMAFILALLGGLSVLLGYDTRLGAVMLVVFLVPVTLSFHRFWGKGERQRGPKQVQRFLNSVALIGGALAFLYYGSGPLSLN